MVLIVLLTALAISMATMPVMIRLAPYLRMVDLPDPRKVHARAVPRIGGIAIILGAMASLLLWLPSEPWARSYLIGSLVLLVFGAADDSMELGHYTKFVGQIVAATAVVYWGGVWVSHLPFISQPVPSEYGKVFTVFALVGVMNAINHSDGLDGLAGGEALLSMGAAAYLAYLAGGTSVVLLAAAVAGGVFGFLRFNTHPAQVFMGDAGSQFIGFSVGVLVVLLTQSANTSLSMALPALIIGLPVVDILAVFGQRVQGGMNWFRATRNHIHHRLLDLGFQHHQVVVIIYSVQALLVSSAIIAAYESDVAVLAIFAVVCSAVFAFLVVAERSGWRVNAGRSGQPPEAGAMTKGAALGRYFRAAAMQFIQATIPLYLLLGGLATAQVPLDVAAVTVPVFAFAALSLLVKTDPPRLMLLRLSLYLGAACEVFLWHGESGQLPEWALAGEAVYFVMLAVAVAAALRMAGADGFRTTPLDFLLAFVVVAAAALSDRVVAGSHLGAEVIVRLAVLFYASELAITGRSTNASRVPQWSLIGVSLLLLGKALSLP